MIDTGFGDHIPPISGKKPFPYIVKKCVDESSLNCHLVADNNQEKALANLLGNPEYLSQVYIPGEREYATHIVFRDQQIVCSLEFEYVFTTLTPIKFKSKAQCLRIRRSPFLDLFSAILSSIGFEGLCCVNYKVQNERPQIIEINPRMGGSLTPFFFSFLRHL